MKDSTKQALRDKGRTIRNGLLIMIGTAVFLMLAKYSCGNLKQW